MGTEHFPSWEEKDFQNTVKSKVFQKVAWGVIESVRTKDEQGKYISVN